MPLTIRRITGDDGALLKELRLAALHEAPYAFGSVYEDEVTRPDEEWADRAALGADGSLSARFVAEDDGVAVGLVGAYRATIGDPQVEVTSMWVAPGHRRRGVAEALVEAALDWAAATGATTSGLWVTRGNAPAELLYRRLGFEETGDHQPLPSDPCKDEVRMQRRLT